MEATPYFILMTVFLLAVLPPKYHAVTITLIWVIALYFNATRCVTPQWCIDECRHYDGYPIVELCEDCMC